MNTLAVAEHMLSTGNYYTAASLGAELGMSAVDASARLWNIRQGKRYTCSCTELPNRKVKVIAIKRRSISKPALWNLAIFNKPLSEAL